MELLVVNNSYECMIIRGKCLFVCYLSPIILLFEVNHYLMTDWNKRQYTPANDYYYDSFNDADLFAKPADLKIDKLAMQGAPESLTVPPLQNLPLPVSYTKRPGKAVPKWNKKV